jgi:hypothetical protein
LSNSKKPTLVALAFILVCTILISASYMQFAKTEIVPSADTTYQVTFVTTPAGSGTTTPLSGTYPHNASEIISISASANSGYSFSNWTSTGSIIFANGASTSTSASTSATINGDGTITANFVRDTYTISVNYSPPTGAGNVSISPDPPYSSGTSVVLTARPNDGWRFSSWGSDLGSANPTSFFISKDTSLTATFVPEVSFAVSGFGTTSPSGTQTFDVNQRVSITAYEGNGYSFSSWSASPSGSVTFDDANAASTTATIKGPGTITANFITYPVTFSSSGGGTGSSTNPSGSQTYKPGQSVPISATAGSGFRFTNWTVTGTITITDTTSSSTSALINGAGTITANFVPITYNVLFAATGKGTISPAAGSKTYNAGQTIPISANPSSGYSFSNWVSTGSITFANAASTSTSATINGNGTITAIFLQNSYGLTVTTVGSGDVSKSPDQASYLSGSIVTLTATPAAGWRFAGWSGDVTGSANPANVTVNKSSAATATFTRITYQVSFTVDGTGTVNPTGLQTFNSGQVVPISATVGSGYVFASWSASPSGSVTFDDANAASTTATINGAGTITATFNLIPATATPTPPPSDNPTPTANPTGNPSSTPNHSPSPTPKSTPTLNPSSVIIKLTTLDNSTVDLTIRGDGASSTVSAATMTTNDSNSTVISLALVGLDVTNGFSNITIPKQAVPLGTTPKIYINSQMAPDQSFTEDANNYYVWYTTFSKTYQLQIVFGQGSSTVDSFPLWIVAVVVVVIVVVAVLVVILPRKLRINPFSFFKKRPQIP